MASKFPYKTMRTKTVASGDDDDYVTDQSAPVGSVTLVSGSRDQGDPITLEVVCEYLLAGDTVTTVARGTVDMSLVKTTGAPAPATRYTDSTTLTSVPGGRVVTFTDLRVGDVVAVRLTNVANPGGPSTKIRVSYRELSGS